ncbi:MAG: hypothetical protein ACTSUN_08185 [Promethearchaeota archaeon]
MKSREIGMKDNVDLVKRIIKAISYHVRVEVKNLKKIVTALFMISIS